MVDGTSELEGDEHGRRWWGEDMNGDVDDHDVNVMTTIWTCGIRCR